MRTPKRKPGEFSSLPKDPHMTESRVRALKAELARVKAQHPKAVEQMHQFAEMGDFSENAGYQAAKGRVRRLLYRMAEIEHELKHAIVIKQNQDISRVDLGHVITVNLGGKEKIYTLLGSTETDPLSGKISQHSPIGKAIFGKQVGDVITIDLPKGPTQIQILAIALPE